MDEIKSKKSRAKQNPYDVDLKITYFISTFETILRYNNFQIIHQLKEREKCLLRMGF